MNRSFKYRLYPTAPQKAALRMYFGHCRFIYNWGLALANTQYASSGKSDGHAAMCKKLTLLKKEPEFSWLADAPACCLQYSLRNLEKAFTGFFRKRSKYPAFKSRREGAGSAGFVGANFSVKDGKLSLSKLSGPVKVRWSHRALPSAPSSCVVSMTPSGKYFVSFVCEYTPKPVQAIRDGVGIDLGLHDFAVLSTGEKVKAPKLNAKYDRLKLLQRRASKKTKGSKNRAKANRKVARAYERITNTRTDFLHKLSTKIVRENQAIGMEDLTVKNMVKNRKLSRAISEQGWRQFRDMVQYKCEGLNRQFTLVDRFFPTSKTCSSCGAINQTLTLKDREWTCKCGALHDRDVNAAKNILAARSVVSACGEDGRPTLNYSKKAVLCEAGI